EDWEERYQYIIELGKQVPAMPVGTQTQENQVQGCMSTVWLLVELEPTSGKLRIVADSDSLIVKGLVAILVAAFAEKSAAEVIQFDVSDIFGQFGLNQHLSPNRRNGLFSMVKRVKELATGHLA
ncbi:MAG: SufE family protein, partial [Planctomycetota bacterium]|nr:SufE family protein [Planctomycetota bacterium]